MSLPSLCNVHLNDHPLVVSLPHAGTLLPGGQPISPGAPPHGTDLDLHLLYSFLQDMGVTTLCNPYSRFAADPNRPREQAILSRTAKGEPIAPPLPPQQALAQCYDPYHRALCDVLAEKRQHFSRVLLLDLHSFTSLPRGEEIKADCVLSDAMGSTCPRPLSRQVERLLYQAGFPCARNKGFTGGHIVRAYAEPPRVSALQIELRTRAYYARASFRTQAPPRDDELFLDAQERLYRFMLSLLSCLDKFQRESSFFTFDSPWAYNRGSTSKGCVQHEPAQSAQSSM